MNKGKYTATAKNPVWEPYAVKEKFQPGKIESYELMTVLTVFTRS